MAKSKKDDKIRTTKGMYPVKCILTPDETREAGFRLAGYYQDIETINQEKKAALADFKNRIEAINDKIHKASIMIKQGIEVRQIECEMVMDYNKNTVTLTRLDTNDVVDRRGMTNEEKQMTLFKESDAKGKAINAENVQQEQLKFDKDNADKKTDKK